MSDSFTRKILEQAEALKQADAAIVPPTPEPPNPQKELGKSDPFAVWFRVAFASNKLLMVLLLSLSAIIYAAMLPFLGAYNLANWVMITVGVGGILLIDCIALIHFLGYRNWRSRLPFELKGWSELVLAKPLKRTEWRSVTVTLVTNSMTTDQQQAYQAAIEVFAHAASRRFYSTDFMDQRQRWQTGKLTATGSANTAVTFELYRWCSGTLTKMHREIGGLQSVIIETGKKSFTVSMPTTD